MFNTITHTAIDAVQTGKKQIVSTVVKHETLADTINKFVDAETAYTKALFDNTVNTMTGFYNLFTNKDFAKEVAETFTPSFTTTKAASKKAK
jgi:hypothetical protein